MDLIHGIQATIKIKTFATGKGADIVGIADLGLLKGIPTKPGNLLEGFTLAVSVEFKNIPGVGYPICGVCMAVCPWGKGKK